MKVTSGPLQPRAVWRSKAPGTALPDDQHRELAAAHLVIAALLRTTL